LFHIHELFIIDGIYQHVYVKETLIGLYSHMHLILDETSTQILHQV